MFTESGPITAETNHESDMKYVDDSLIELIWHDLDGQVVREQIRQVASEIADEFRTATITTFVPIFIRRQAREKLRTQINPVTLTAQQTSN
jgi:hypothetical protein